MLRLQRLLGRRPGHGRGIGRLQGVTRLAPGEPVIGAGRGHYVLTIQDRYFL
jgi:hypothetical protein